MYALNTIGDIGIAAMAIINGIDPDRLAVYARCMGMLDAHDAEDSPDAFRDNYAGVFNSLNAWAANQLEQTGEFEAILKQCPDVCASASAPALARATAFALTLMLTEWLRSRYDMTRQ